MPAPLTLTAGAYRAPAMTPELEPPGIRAQGY